MPIGYLITTCLVGLGMLVSLSPPFRSGTGGVAAWLVSALPNESPSLALYWLAASTALALSQGNLSGTGAWIALGFATMTFVCTPVLVRRSRCSAASLARALDTGLGPEWRDGPAGARLGARVPWWRIVFAPLPVLHPGVMRISNIAYGEAGRRNRLDLYRRSDAGDPGPVLIHLHGGGFASAPGRRSFYARRMLFRLARQGWVCISATYRLGSAGTFPNDVIDVKKVVAWARAHAEAHGGDPERIVLAGSSYGARLATLAGFTAADASLQPGFEGADTSVAAVVGLYGYYGETDSHHGLPTAPHDYADRGSPPLLIVHGDQDTLTPAGSAASLAEDARCASANPVVYAQLPGAQHSFDLLTSIRFEAVIDCIETFTIAVTAA